MNGPAVGRHIFLVGFMGSGKSTVAALLSRDLSMPFVDLDDSVVATAGKSVSRIFTEDGEEVFRDAESAELRTLLTRAPSVVACGGGVVLRAENRALLKQMGMVIYLEVTAGEALARIGDAETRPLLAGTSGTIAATSLLSAREALYRSVADLSIDTVGRTPEQIAGQIRNYLEGDAT